MKLWNRCWATSCLLLTAAEAKKRICPLQGQQFPAPTDLASEKQLQDATKAIEDAINANLTMAPYNTTTFSIGMFSTKDEGTKDEGLLYEYHHTDPSVAASTIGTRKVDADSVYRIASITKILTLYMWLINDGDKRFNDPITDFIPQLAKYQVAQDDYVAPSWHHISVADLASYLAGVARDYGLNDVSMPGYLISQIQGSAAQDLPNNPQNGVKVPASDDPVCGYLTANQTYESCTQDQYPRAISNLAASFPPGYTPLYSNANYAILAIALSNLAGRSEADIFESSLVDPLRLNGSTLSPPSPGPRSVIPFGDVKASGWNNSLGPLNGAAGAFSTTNDLVAIGRSILNSSLISKTLTRRWFSSVTFVDTTDQAVGRGWEIFRRRINGHTVDLYTKSGFWGAYNSVLFLIPDYDFGFTLLTASNGSTGKVTDLVPNLIANTLLPVLEDIARQQASDNFAGNYTSSGTNTSISVTTDDWPGLKVISYIANGIDIIESVFGLFGKDVDFRLVPNQLYQDNHVGFTGLYQPPTTPPPDDEFYWPCQSWLDIDDFTYASVPLGQMVFEVDERGKASSVQLTALRERLMRQ